MKILRQWHAWLWTRDRYDLAASALLFGLIGLSIATYESYAISNDEEVQRRYGELILRYYASGFTDRALFEFRNLYLYGGLFDVISGLAERLLPFIDPYEVRHLLCALFGLGGVAMTWATARLIAGPRAGAIAACALAVCGTWYGSSFNHTKDIPFATAMIGATFFLCRVWRGLPTPRRSDVLGFGLMLGAALGIRVLGLLTVGYVAIVISVASVRMRDDLPDRLHFFVRSVAAFAPALVIAYLIMVAAWPWAALAPLNPIRGLLDFGGFHYKIPTILGGQIYTMADVPRWYVPAYLAIKLPLVMLLGAAVAAMFAIWSKPASRPALRLRDETALIVTMAAFPVLCEVVAHGPAFSGLRHFLFVVPLLAVLAGTGLHRLLADLEGRRRLFADAASAVVAALLIWNATLLVRLHPYEYLYFNPLVGGLSGATGRYITDYWVNIMPEAVENLEAYIDDIDKTAAPARGYSVAVCGERLPFEHEAGERLRWTADWDNADFFIAPTHMNCDGALAGRVIARIERLGAVIGVVKDRRALVKAAIARHQ